MWIHWRTHRLLLLQVLLFLFLSLSFIVPNGLFRCQDGVCGLWIGAWHLHDSLWHLSLISTAFRTFPFIHPEFAGATLSGYNYFLDLLLYALSFLHLSPLTLFFQIFPFLTALLYVYLVIRYAKDAKYSISQTNALAFFLFFGSSFSYLATLYTSHTLYYASMRGFPVVTSIQPAMMFLNLQFALSLPLIITAMMVLKRQLTVPRILFLALLTFIVAGLKFYGGVMLFGYLGMTLLVKLWDDRRYLLTLKAFGCALSALALAYFIFYHVQGSTKLPFAFAPFAMTHLMIEDPVLFFNHNLTLARYFLSGSGHFSPRLWGIEIYSILLFLLLNFGTRIFGLFVTGMHALRRRLDSESAIFLILILISTLIPILFVQDGGWYNTMQFLYYGIFFASFLSAKPLAALFTSARKPLILLGIIWILLTIPNHLDQLRYLSEPQSVFTSADLSAFNFLAHTPPGAIYSSGTEKENAYLPAFTGHQTYFSDIDQLMVTHVDYVSRALSLSHPSTVLTDPLVQYVYIKKSHDNATALVQAVKQDPDYRQIWDNESAVIYGRIR